MKKILLLDNYDSFTYNLHHYLNYFDGYEVEVYRNDKISIADVAAFDMIVLSPGPGLPEESGILLELVKTYASTKKMLGVCLGLQAMVVAFGGKLKQLDRVQHGKSSDTYIKSPENCLFKGIRDPVVCGRYHSWIADAAHIPDCFDITAMDEDGNVMAIAHKEYPMNAVQFHPESIMTEQGLKMIENWLNC